MQCPRPALEPGPLDPKSGTLTIWTPRLPHSAAERTVEVIKLTFKNNRLLEIASSFVLDRLVEVNMTYISLSYDITFRARSFGINPE